MINIGETFVLTVVQGAWHGPFDPLREKASWLMEENRATVLIDGALLI